MSGLDLLESLGSLARWAQASEDLLTYKILAARKSQEGKEQR